MSWDISNVDEWTYDQIPLGAMTLESGTAVHKMTGDWRVKRPVWDQDKCKNCLMCWIYCPDSCILTEDRTMCGIDYDHCKGCGVCVASCPFDALHLINEKDAREMDAKEGK
jgi:pyruvate ferredoxin oxidoreductase delta subunit